MNKKILIFGTGGHSKVVFSEILKIQNLEILGFIDEIQPINTIINKDLNLRVLGKIKDLKRIVDNNTFGIIAVGQNYIREKISLEVKQVIKNFKWEKIISNDSIISKNTKIGEGTVIISGSTINVGTNIGNHCLINTNSTIEHDNCFYDFSSCGPGTTTGGNVNLGKLSYIGIGSTISNKINIDENTVIGGHSFVNNDCEKNSLYYGVPAKKIRNRKKIDKYL